jgi:hypothetical protein
MLMNGTNLVISTILVILVPLCCDVNCFFHINTFILTLINCNSSFGIFISLEQEQLM